MTKKNTSWGGRFTQSVSEIASKFSNSVDVDSVLAEKDIIGSIAYAESLQEAGVINKSELIKIKRGLNQIKKEIETGKFKWNPSLEDVHMNIESALEKKIGDSAKKLHTGRSRNDQVVTDLKLFLKDETKTIKKKIKDLQKNILNKAQKHYADLMPGFTHLQIAQPVTLGHHLLAYFEMLQRDTIRFENNEKILNQMPLGVGALAGNRFAINRPKLAKKLGFTEITKNSIDTVSDRDFVTDVSYSCSMLAVHLSRMSEEIILWSSSQFDYVQLPEELCTGSSIMPQKKNPDMAELIRGGSSQTLGNLVTTLSLMKNQSLSYNRDNQEDKEPLFKSINFIKDALEIMSEMIKGMSFNIIKMLQDLDLSEIGATDFAEYLVLKGVPFREAHEITGKTVKEAERKNIFIREFNLSELKKIHPKIEKDIYKFIDPKRAIHAKNSLGGTSPKKVKAAIIAAKKTVSS